MKIGKYLFMFLLGCFIYSLIEVTARGFTHWTMCLTGGVCMLTIYSISKNFPYIPLWKKSILATILITGIEFIVGYFVNIKFGWNVWDYTSVPVNFMGQICLLYSLMWYGLSFLGFYICKKADVNLSYLEKSFNI